MLPSTSQLAPNMWILVKVTTNLHSFFGLKLILVLECKTQEFQERWLQSVPIGTEVQKGEAIFNQFKSTQKELVFQQKMLEERKTITSSESNKVHGSERTNLYAHIPVDVVKRADRKICQTMLRYSADKPKSSYAQVQMFSRKMSMKIFNESSI